MSNRGFHYHRNKILNVLKTSTTHEKSVNLFLAVVAPPHLSMPHKLNSTPLHYKSSDILESCISNPPSNSSASSRLRKLLNHSSYLSLGMTQSWSLLRKFSNEITRTINFGGSNLTVLRQLFREGVLLSLERINYAIPPTTQFSENAI